MDETAPIRNCKAVVGGMNAIDVQESPQATSYRLSREASGQSGGRASDTRATFVLIQTFSSRAYAPVGREAHSGVLLVIYTHLGQFLQKITHFH